jgi:uncharacterized repeat protein (TIGR01451 family)
MSNLDSFVIEVDPSRTSLCSAHYFDERGGLVAQGWYEGGSRFLDVTNPSDIKQVGYWIPDKNVTWGAYYAPTDPRSEIVYALDTTRGVDVIRVKRGQPDFSTPPQGGGSGGSGPGSGSSGASPNIRLRIGDRRRAVRRGQKVRWTISLRNGGRAAAKGIEVTANLPRGVKRVRGGRRAARGRQVRFSVKSLRYRKVKRVRFVAKILRRYRGRRVEISAAATVNGDSDPRSNFHVDRDRVIKPRKSRARRASASSDGHETMAERTARMPAVTAPELGPELSTRAYANRFGRLCRIALD